ncbi:murein biosynthesis integral membrane protein MurJ [Arsenophonus symbiont of Ornithomya chloropus]|uniref:murein biosynthesis integral membrane protein MurJ n=1 Tax=Arsenophonus symbiont of Ornithomya chloropus TaxID=634121 RepID=UPI0032B2E087
MNLLRTLATISSMTMFSRMLGFIRDAIIARFFGVGVETDAFFIAFRLPNLLRCIFAEGAFSQAFVPILAEYKDKKADATTRMFIANVSGFLTLILAIIVLIGMFSAPWIIYLITPGFSEITNKFDLTLCLLKITFPYILFISLVSLTSAILNTWNCFSVPAFTPVLLNISMIIGVLFLAPYCKPPILALGWGILMGGILQLLFQLPFLKKIGMLVLPCISFKNKDMWRVIKLMGPLVIVASISQISLIINTMFASFLCAGSVSWIYYADRLMELPNGVLGVGLSTILLPSLAKSISIGDDREYQRLINLGLKLCFLLALPCAIALAILAHPLTVSLFQYGNFTSYDSIMTQYALIAYCSGLMGVILVKVLAPGFYSRKDIKTPLKIAIITLLLTQLMNFIFVDFLKHVGLALSLALSSCFHALMLYLELRRKKFFSPLAGWGKFLLKLIIALIVMIFVLLLTLNFIPILEQGNMVVRIFRLLSVIFIAAISYFTTLFILGLRLRDF